jgi:hypothetical protein
MTDYADLEISLHRHDPRTYALELRFNLPGSDADVRLGFDRPCLAQFNLDALEALAHDPAAYGQALTDDFFSDPAFLTAFAQARASTQATGASLRLRLLIGPSAPELHRLRWETLRDPQGGAPLFAGESLLFSRYLSSVNWRPVRLRPKASLRALLAIASPSNLAEYGLAAIDVPAELARAQEGLGQIVVQALPEGGSSPKKASLENLLSQLRDNFDILYLVCHGTFKEGESWLWLEDEAGEAARVSGTELVQRIRELNQHPRLVVLVSCQSAGAGEGDVLASLGPRLAEAGIPAVIAMQGNLSMETASRFMSTFFQELQRDGQIDRAMSAARGAVRQRPDAWMPALFMRLKSGRIWYVPGFALERKGFDKWRLFVQKIEEQVCTPILGPGLNDALLDPQGTIARLWAETYHYPMEPHERESLPQVAQFLAINQYERAPYDELANYVKQVIRTRYGDLLPPELHQRSALLDDMILAVGAHRRQHDPADPYRALAELPLPIYITANYDNLLAAALQEAGRDPQVMLCPWNEAIEKLESVYDREPDYTPTPARPLVYHLFGRLSEPRSIVLTEDDYFKFLIGVTRNSNLIRPEILGALVDSALLLLGFRLEDWQFRVLFHSLLDQQGNILRGAHPHIAAQIEPEEGRTLNPERARDYLEDYYGSSREAAKIKISLYWGSVDDFIRDLIQQRQMQAI